MTLLLLLAEWGEAVVDDTEAIIEPWTLYTRSTAWTLETRDTALELYERDTAWTLDEEDR